MRFLVFPRVLATLEERVRFVGWLIACACASAKVHVDPGPTEKMDSSGSLQRELSIEETDMVESV